MDKENGETPAAAGPGTSGADIVASTATLQPGIVSDTLFEFLKQFVTAERLQRFDDVLAQRTRRLTLVLENIHHAHNASACLRTCDCFGIQDVHIIESQNSFEPNQDIALGASQWLTIHRYCETEAAGQDTSAATTDCLKQLRDAGYRILATSPRQNSLPLDAVSVDERTAIIFGAEQLGVSETAIREADELVHIPMFGFTESFNVSVSVALVFQDLVSRLRASGTEWCLGDDEVQELRDRWVRQSLGSKLEPLCRRYEADHS